MAVVPRLLKHVYYVPLINGGRRYDLGVWFTKQLAIAAGERYCQDNRLTDAVDARRVWIGYA